MIEKYFQGDIPDNPVIYDEQSKNIAAAITHLPDEINKYLSSSADFDFGAALDEVWKLINLANKYVEEKSRGI